MAKKKEKEPVKPLPVSTGRQRFLEKIESIREKKRQRLKNENSK